MKNKTKRQHYVPKTYLKHFSRENKGQHFIHAVKIEEFTKNKSFDINIINVCLEKDIYTLPGEFPLLLEDLYGNIETDYSKVYELLIDPLKSNITEWERGLIITTVVTMLFRTTKMPSNINRVTNQIVEMGHRAHQKTGGALDIGGEKFSFDGKTVKEIQNEIKSRGKHVIAIKQVEFAMKLIKYRMVNDMIKVIRLDNEISEFITSDNPVSCINETAPFLAPFDPTNTLSLPLDNKHVLFLIPKPMKNDRLIVFKINETGEEAFRQMLKVNDLQYKHAESFLLGIEEAIKRYVYVYNSIEVLTNKYRA